MSFRIFYLPHVVLTELLQTMDLGDITCLALSSRRSYRLVKVFNRKPLKLHITHLTNSPYSHFGRIAVDVHFGIRTRLNLNVAFDADDEGIVEVQGSKVMLYRLYDGAGTDTLVFNYEDPVFGLKSLVEFAQDLFSLKVISGAGLDANSLWVMDWLDSRQESLGEACIRHELTAEEYGNALSNLNTDNLSMYATPPIQFQFTGEFRQRDTLTIENGWWITINHLLAMNTGMIKVYDSSLRSFDINRFLKSWIKGDMPRARCVEVHLDDFDFESALEELEVVEAKRVVKENFSNKIYIKFTSTHEVQQTNGVKALIGYEENKFYFSTI